MIKLIHFADTHIGVENYGRIDPDTGLSTRVGDFLNRVDEVIDYALNQKADLAVFAGDAFKNRDPNPTLLREFGHRIKRLADEVPTLLLVGNHDLPGIAAKANSLDIFDALDVPGIIVGRRPEGRVIETRSGPVYLAWMPYPMRNRLLSQNEHQGKSIKDLEVALRDAVATILADLVCRAEEYDMPRVLVGHFTVAEAMFGSEQALMVGRDIAVTGAMLTNSAWDYVALGHIHKHQTLKEIYPPIVYSGSLERIDFGEEQEQKGFCWVDLARSKTTWSFIPVAARPFRTIRVDATATEIEDPTEMVLGALAGEQLDGTVVRILVTLRPDQVPALRTSVIEAFVPTVSSLTILRDVVDEVRVRLSDLAVETLTPIELLRTYLETKDIASGRIEILVERAEELIGQ